jgi:hypothetical protein
VLAHTHTHKTEVKTLKLMFYTTDTIQGSPKWPQNKDSSSLSPYPQLGLMWFLAARCGWEPFAKEPNEAAVLCKTGPRRLGSPIWASRYCPAIRAGGLRFSSKFHALTLKQEGAYCGLAWVDKSEGGELNSYHLKVCGLELPVSMGPSTERCLDCLSLL